VFIDIETNPKFLCGAVPASYQCT